MKEAEAHVIKTALRLGVPPRVEIDQRAFGVLSGRYMRPAKAPPLTASTSPVT